MSADRRAFLVRMSSLAGAAVVPGAWAAEPPAESPVVKTSKGQLRGLKENGVLVFKGVPYAGPSEGANRFKPPTKLEPWTGVRDATQYGPQAIQNRDPNSLPGSATGVPSSENCQFLNVWTPGVQDGKR